MLFVSKILISKLFFQPNFGMVIIKINIKIRLSANPKLSHVFNPILLFQNNTGYFKSPVTNMTLSCHFVRYIQQKNMFIPIFLQLIYIIINVYLVLKSEKKLRGFQQQQKILHKKKQNKNNIIRILSDFTYAKKKTKASSFNFIDT